MSSHPRTRSKRGGLIALLIIGVLIALFLVGLAAGIDPSRAANDLVVSFFPPRAVTEQGQQIRDLYTIVFIIAAVIFFVVEGLILWTVLRYRRRPGDDTLPPQTHGNMTAEVIWTVVPTVIVAFLFVVSWQTLNAVDTVAAQPEHRIRAVAGQFQWTFDYLDDQGETVFTQLLPVGEEGGMVVPAGESVQLELTSPDVIHAFYVPQFLYKRDVVPGRVNVFDFTVNAEDAGQTFHGQCAELCGAGHRVMLFDVHAYTPEQYDAWLAEKIEQANATPPPPPNGEPGEGTVLEITAVNLDFIEDGLTVPADEPFQIVFDNQEAIPHNVAIHEGSPTGPEIWQGEIFTGPDQRTYDVPALPAGTYGFICTVHPNMTGTLTAE
jgi:cytochrome c oxidase subunit 2